MGELGASSPRICMALPLPLHYCRAQVLLAGARLQQWSVVKRAAGMLLPRFIVTTPVRPLWQAHPMDRFELQHQQVKAAAQPLLRLLVECLLEYASHKGQQAQEALTARGGGNDAAGVTCVEDSGGASGSGLAGTAASRELLLSLSHSRVPQQVALLDACKRLLLAMQVGWWRAAAAVAAGDPHALSAEATARPRQLIRVPWHSTRNPGGRWHW
jgi:hypothetical protein